MIFTQIQTRLPNQVESLLYIISFTFPVTKVWSQRRHCSRQTNAHNFLRSGFSDKPGGKTPPTTGGEGGHKNPTLLKPTAGIITISSLFHKWFTHKTVAQFLCQFNLFSTAKPVKQTKKEPTVGTCHKASGGMHAQRAHEQSCTNFVCQVTALGQLAPHVVTVDTRYRDRRLAQIA